jgi:hypothetical protein
MSEAQRVHLAHMRLVRRINARRTLQLDLIDQPTKEANLLTDMTAHG